MPTMSSPRPIPFASPSTSRHFSRMHDHLLHSSFPEHTSPHFGPGASSSSVGRTPTPTHIHHTGTPVPAHRRRVSHLRSSIFDPPARLALPTEHKEWSVLSVEWPIRGWEHYVRDVDADGDEEETRERVRGIVFGDGVYKVDIGAYSYLPVGSYTRYDTRFTPKSSPRVARTNTELPPSLSLFLSCLTLEPAPVEYCFTVSIFIGIRPAHTPAGQRFASTPWSWSAGILHEFSKETDYADIPLPSYDELAQQAPGEWLLCVRVASAAGNGPHWTEPDQTTVPVDVLDGLGALLDAPSGDVQFICLEHARREGEEGMVSRKRVIYAHTEILSARSDYFKALLAGGFRETEGSGRKTVIVDDASFSTVYWMLRFLYCNELQFSPEDDVRHAMDQLHVDTKSVQRLLSSHYPGEWDFRTVPQAGDEDVEHELASSQSPGTSMMSLSIGDLPADRERDKGDDRVSPRNSGALLDKGKSTTTMASTTDRRLSVSTLGSYGSGSRASSLSAPGYPADKPPARRAAPPSSMAKPGSSNTTTTTNTTTPKKPGAGPGSGPSLVSPPPRRTHSKPPPAPAPDPHVHPPTAPPPAASALCVYVLAHRYGLAALEGLAKEHILKGLTVENCVPMLLATCAYDGLHPDVLDFVVDYFGMVQVSPEFQVCVKEVASGVWGDMGGEVLLGLFKRL